MKRYTYNSDCIDAKIEVELNEDDKIAVIDDGIVYITPNYRVLRNGKETSTPITESVFRRDDECKSIKQEQKRFEEFVNDILSKNTVTKPLQQFMMDEYPEQWEELRRDPINWFLKKTEEWHVGDDAFNSIAD
jgi:hypothetical protein